MASQKALTAASTSPVTLLKALLVLILSLPAAISQTSSAEAVASLQSRFDRDRAGLEKLLGNIPNSPQQLGDGSIVSALTSLQSELDSLNKQIGGARSIVDGKMKSVQSNQGLSATDKSTLLAELNRQLAPLNELGRSISSLREKIDSLVSDQIPKWDQSYKSYADIMGMEAAREKLRKSIREFTSAALGK